jgi:hypothetical protein
VAPEVVANQTGTKDALFGEVERRIKEDGPRAAFDWLIGRLREAQDYRSMFEARLMRKRFQMGLPLMQAESAASLPDPAQREYQSEMIAAARETGGLFLADGDILRAWPYFRAIGEAEPVAEALENAANDREDADGLIAIALQEGVHPRKGIELVLAKHGMCRAINVLGMFQIQKDRDKCIALLARGLHAEIVERMGRAIEAEEGKRPETRNLPEMMRDREWLFGEWTYYVDTSHLASILPYVPETDDDEILELFVEMCEYGKRLSANFHYKGDPPFEDAYEGYGRYASALLGRNADGNIEWFRRKADETDVDRYGDMPRQVLIRLLASVERYSEAASEMEKLPREAQSEPLTIPQLLYLSEDYARLRDFARERGDVLAFAAATAAVPTPSAEKEG